ncbi:hypothetical protein F5X97DRAFT_324568 [Nemania serpens]|nr:hypothetical protein F5X97DRAFT_324568 [Nemania serpens]
MSQIIYNIILRPWYTLLGLPLNLSPEWHHDRVREELIEYREAKTWLEALSEASDVFFSISRAKYDGVAGLELPQLNIHHVPIYGYLLAKFTSRRLFYWALAFLCGVPHHSSVREVVNPTKDHKLETVALRHDIEPEKFKRIGRRLRRVWLLFP